LIAFDPFRLGWKAWLYCLGIAVVNPFLLEKLLELWASPKLVKTVTTVACISALVSLILLAVIRGDLLSEQIAAPNAVTVVETDAPPVQAQSTFYERTLGLLRFVMALLALAMEVGAGIALYEARRWSETGEDGNVLRERLFALQNEMIELGHELWHLENEGAVFEKQFWRDFYRSLLNGVKRGAVQKLTVIVLAFALFAQVRTVAADHLNVVVLVDLSQSVDAKDNDNKTEFQKNIDGVTRVLASLPAGSRVSIFGITNDSFGKPYPLLTAQLSDDEGYFRERLTQGRRQLIRAWQERALTLRPQFSHTDVLGAILIAAQVLAEMPAGRKKVLVFFSDMRQSTRVVNLEGSRATEQESGATLMQRQGLRPDLRGVHIYAFGVDANGVSVEYWQNLREIWLDYFRRKGPVVEGYSVLRTIPALGQ
jgi:von Willebrand factor type A domain